ncbi:hypothetical protein F5B22DRAFT_489601 [Xylaria bambusicola]|uniref:uncharacterized protein n=1 Tax=Xylaria bambusicola TaxID=326684 RepID=UPI00200794F5|nr:uncharacterized protein F5B22DRAFT_489601 [Xylaria bambusicola]KAI0505972.1 hypothetical protein F5B22DRAFT_489601 [Xylaria bambusicola]
MSEGNLYISSGQCFYGEGQISDPRFIPCGNAAVAGTQACCFQGDFCLASNVCYDNDTSVTYITGCTDATYSSSKCPHKAGYPDQQWVALARCDGDDIDLFSGCGHHKDEVVIKHEDCTCDAASALISNPASGQPTLNQIGLLPTTAGGTISFNPTALPTATASSDSSSGGLTTGAKAGIGVGVGVGVPVIAAIIFLFFFLRRKKRRAEQHQEPQQQQFRPPPSELPPQEAHAQMMQQHSPPPVYSTDTQNAQYGWLRHKPELHGDPAHKVELPGDSHAHGNNTGVNRMDSIQKTPYESYPPSEYGADVSHRESETPSLPFVSPQTTGSTDVPQAAGGHQRTGSSNMDPISEHRFDGRQY